MLQGPVLKERVIGQDDAVDSIVAALCRARVGLKDPHRPAAAMLLVGPTGVGKTELTKVLAEQYFGSQVG
jgi:ATP-dependent Clp protease ATP-binding subunit ClpC